MTDDLAKLIGKTLNGKYRVVRPIGSGGMGAVFEAVQLDLERPVALKILLERDARTIARFRQEALATAKLSSPHIVAVTDFYVGKEGASGSAAHPFLVMELLDGVSLRQLLARKRTLGVDRATRIAAQMLSALSVAHRAGVVHRDVKPPNVFIVTSASGESIVKLLDFGIAKMTRHAGAVQTTMGTMLGTPAYVAPEQILSTDVDARADVHAVGVCLYEMLVGVRPWQGSGQELALAIAHTPAPLVRQSGVSPELAAVIACALEKKPSRRYQDASAMLQALLSVSPIVITEQRAAPIVRKTVRMASSPALPGDFDTDVTERDPPHRSAAHAEAHAHAHAMPTHDTPSTVLPELASPQPAQPAPPTPAIAPARTTSPRVVLLFIGLLLALTGAGIALRLVRAKHSAPPLTPPVAPSD